MKRNINTLYFSATDSTRKVVTGIADGIARRMDGPMTINHIDFTLPKRREKRAIFSENDLVVVGVPVYAGRVPNLLLSYLHTISGNGALAVAVVLYGNRDYDDALLELADILAEQNFTVIAGGAFVGEHSFSKTLGANRPDEKDMTLVNDFAGQIYTKLTVPTQFHPINVKGDRPYRKYYVPKDENGAPVKDFRLITPVTNEDCTDCKLCAEVCPIGSIDFDKPSAITGICIKCCACIKKCPVQAKYFDNPNYLRHKHELEIAFDRRSEPETFI